MGKSPFSLDAKQTLPHFFAPQSQKTKEKRGGSSSIPSRVQKSAPPPYALVSSIPQGRGGSNTTSVILPLSVFSPLPSITKWGEKEGIKENKNVWRPRIGDAAIASKTGIQRLTLASSASPPLSPSPSHLFNLLSSSSPGWSHSLPFPFSLLDRMRVCMYVYVCVMCVRTHESDDFGEMQSSRVRSTTIKMQNCCVCSVRAYRMRFFA